MTTPRPAIVEITADSRSLGARLREASGKLASFAASSARVVGRYGAASAATLGGPLFDPKFYAGLGGKLKGGAAAAGAALVVSAGQVRNFEEGLIRLKINAGATAEEIDAVRRTTRRASVDTGVGSEKILAGVQKYVDLTGDFAGATKQITTFARTAQASDSVVGDVAQTAAAMSDALRILPEDTEAAFSALITQGKAGSVTMKELARELPQLAPTMAQFKGGTGLAGLRELGAAIQIINKRYNSASESATAFQSLGVALQSRAKQLQDAGVNVFDVGPDGVKRLKSFSALIDAIGASKLMKDPTLLYKTLGRAEAIAPLQQLIRLRQEFEAIKKAGEDTGAVERDLEEYEGSKVGKFNNYYNQAKEGAQAVAVDVIETGIKGYGGWRAALSGDLDAVRAEASRLKADEATRRGWAVPVMARYAAQGQIISPQQAEQLAVAEGALATQQLFSTFGFAPRVTDEQRAGVRQQFGTVQTSEGGEASVDADGNLATTSRRGLEILFERAMTNALQKSGLAGPLQIGRDAVAGAVKSAGSQRRRPGG